VQSDQPTRIERRYVEYCKWAARTGRRAQSFTSFARLMHARPDLAARVDAYREAKAR
jgi:hypothetical protein